jgi:Chaperone of endosialidase
MSIVLNGSAGITAPGTETFGDGTALGGATNPIVSMAKGANNYVQGYIVNNTDGANASADLVCYPSNGTDSSGWIDMGITGPTFSQAAYGITGANEGYIFMSAPSGASKTGNLVLATDSTGTQNAIKFATGGFGSTTERMRIDSSGNLLVGTTSALATAAKVQVSFDGATTSARTTTSSFSNGGRAENFYATTTLAGYIQINSSTVSYVTSSDYRLKHDVAPMTNALERVAALKPVIYKWNVDGASGEGFIAHELQEIVPDAVVGEKDAVDADGNPVYQGIDTSFLVATLTAAIQEQQAIITQLQADIADMKVKLG